MNPFKKIINWYFSKKALPYWCILILDLFVMLLAGLFTYFIFIYRRQVEVDIWLLVKTLCMYVVPCLVGARMFHTYAGIIRYSSFVDLMHVAYANGVSLAVAYAWHYFIYRFPTDVFYHLHFRHIVLMYVIGTAMMWGVRALVKSLYDVAMTDGWALRTLIYGVKEGGIGLAKSIRAQNPKHFALKGFIAPDNSFKHNLVMGEKVYSADCDLEAVIDKLKIKAVLVSPFQTENFRNNTDLQDKLLASGVKIFMAQGAKELSAADLQEGSGVGDIQLKEVSVEDLLPRDEIKVDLKAMGELISGKRILITGAAGSIGSELVKQIAQYKPEAMVLIDQAETPEHDVRLMMAHDYPEVEAETVVTSICKADRMERIFREFRPDYVFHAAAYKHVPMMENNPSEAVQNNIYGTKVIADLSVKYGVKKFVMVSTDKAVNPTNVMGCSKRICEIYVQSLNHAIQHGAQQGMTQFVTTRFGNVLGSNGSVIPLFREQIKKGGPVTVTHPDIIRYFMLIPEACKLVLEAGTKGNGGEIFVFDMGKPVRIADLAKRMIRLSGAENVEIKYTGLRAGEKLYEEVLNDQESTKPTFHEKIRIAEVREYDFNEVSRQIDELIAVSKQYDDMATVAKMKEIVPEYKSKNSVYEELDQKVKGEG
jgi:FlaA1/EpsC-like NDP-sugar epimerase